jgi:MFS superfamily sulfate permease-like transporter
MKVAGILLRLVLLSLVAAIFTLLTSAYGKYIASPLPGQHWQLHRSLTPKISELPEFIGEAMLIALCALIGRVMFRLRLSHRSRLKHRSH